jgi:hypothetical protein
MSVGNMAEEVKGKHLLVRFCFLGRIFFRVRITAHWRLKVFCLKITVETLVSHIGLLGEKLVAE